MPEISGKKARSKKIIGWRELVDLPEWGVRGVKTKVDTGARTSSLHVENIEHLSDNRVRFEVALSRKDPDKRVAAEASLVRSSRIRSSTGHRQERLIVSTKVKVGDFEREIEISLVSRKGMLCRMLLGRRAIEGDLVVDPDQRYLLSRSEARELGVLKRRSQRAASGKKP